MSDITKYFKREVEGKIKKWLDHGYIVAIIGARQVGKTTLLKKIEAEEKNPFLQPCRQENLVILNTSSLAILLVNMDW